MIPHVLKLGDAQRDMQRGRTHPLGFMRGGFDSLRGPVASILHLGSSAGIL